MIINPIGNIRVFNPFLAVNNSKKAEQFKYKYNIGQDTVSFSSKRYDTDSVKTPTMHCAYCGTKVYNDQQIDSLAKEMLTLKSERLEGKIKSVLEKMSEAKYSPDLALAKRIENDDRIKFFNKFLEDAQSRAYLKVRQYLNNYIIKMMKKLLKH